MDEAIYSKIEGDAIYIKAVGHVTAALCPDLKNRCFLRFDRQPPVKAVYLDLGACEYMDSTFLGLIVGLTKRLMASSGRKITLFGVSDTCLGLLRTIGVLKLVEVGKDKPPFPTDMEGMGKGAVATAEFLLDAHEELSSLSDENRAKFQALTTMLRDSLRNPDRGE